MEREMEDGGVSLHTIWRVLKKKLWWITCVSLIVALGSVLLVHFAINPATSYYQIEFTMKYPASESMKYPDGTPFYYQDMVLLSSLEKAKESDERFANVDVAKMAAKDGITVKEKYGTYTLKVLKSYFKDQTTATTFLRTVAQLPTTTAKQKAGEIDYALDEKIFGDSGFEDRIDLLEQQKQSILAQYDEWINSYRGNYSVSGKTLKNYRTEVAVVLSDSLRNELLDELTQKGYVTMDRLEGKIEQLEADLKTVNDMYEEVSKLASDAQNSEAYEEVLSTLVMRKMELQKQYDTLTAKDAENKIKEFEAKISIEYEKLSKAAATVKGVATELFEQESRTTFSSTMAEISGGTNLFVVGLGVFIAVFLLVCAVVCGAEGPKVQRAIDEARAKKEEKTD